MLTPAEQEKFNYLVNELGFKPEKAYVQIRKESQSSERINISSENTSLSKVRLTNQFIRTLMRLFK